MRGFLFYNAFMKIVEIIDPESIEARGALEICHEAFPIEELDPDEHLLECFRLTSAEVSKRERSDHYWAAVDNGVVIGIAFFNYIKETHLGFIPYLAVRSQVKGKGLGTQLYQALVARIEADSESMGDPASGVCFEVEKLDGIINEEMRIVRSRRIRFYERLGAVRLDGIKFTAPPLGENLPPVPYDIMFHPLAVKSRVYPRPLLEDVIKTIAGYGYGMDAQDVYYRMAMESLQ
jgi:GNAT superfamily N-acetyltransferase